MHVLPKIAPACGELPGPSQGENPWTPIEKVPVKISLDFQAWSPYFERLTKNCKNATAIFAKSYRLNLSTDWGVATFLNTELDCRLHKDLIAQHFSNSHSLAVSLLRYTWLPAWQWTVPTSSKLVIRHFTAITRIINHREHNFSTTSNIRILSLL